jgi:hypothetical protein
VARVDFKEGRTLHDHTRVLGRIARRNARNSRVWFGVRNRSTFQSRVNEHSVTGVKRLNRIGLTPGAQKGLFVFAFPGVDFLTVLGAARAARQVQDEK